MTSRERAQKIMEILENKKASDVQLLDLQGKSSLCDYFVIASASSQTHVKALADELIYRLEQEEQLRTFAESGLESGRWVALDYLDVVVHIFRKEERSYYDLEKFWHLQRSAEATEGSDEQQN